MSERTVYLCLFLFVSGCGGDAFYSIVTPDAQDEAATDGAPPPDDAADSDRKLELDASTDAPADVVGDTTPPCTAPQNYNWTCTIPNVGMEVVGAPAQYCTDWGGVRWMPTECTTCKENYTCACLVAHSQTKAQCCTDGSGHVHVSCL